MKINKDRLHNLFMSGMLVTDIAMELGITYDSCQSTISKERKKDPLNWPLRKDKTPTIPVSSNRHTPMHLYECTDCFCTFGVEDYEDIDQSVVICPHCHTDESLEDRGYGFFTVTIPVEEEAS